VSHRPRITGREPLPAGNEVIIRRTFGGRAERNQGRLRVMQHVEEDIADRPGRTACGQEEIRVIERLDDAGYTAIRLDQALVAYSHREHARSVGDAVL
jgi:hypothetical protein